MTPASLIHLSLHSEHIEHTGSTQVAHRHRAQAKHRLNTGSTQASQPRQTHMTHRPSTDRAQAHTLGRVEISKAQCSGLGRASPQPQPYTVAAQGHGPWSSGMPASRHTGRHQHTGQEGAQARYTGSGLRPRAQRANTQALGLQGWSTGRQATGVRLRLTGWSTDTQAHRMASPHTPRAPAFRLGLSGWLRISIQPHRSRGTGQPSLCWPHRSRPPQ